MTAVQRLAHFVADRSSDDETEVVRSELMIRVLDGLGCAPRSARSINSPGHPRSGELVGRPQPDRPARVPAGWYLGHQRHLGTHAHLPRAWRRRRSLVTVNAGPEH